eukprot:5335074-Prymnesium_polylepis.1
MDGSTKNGDPLKACVDQSKSPALPQRLPPQGRSLRNMLASVRRSTPEETSRSSQIEMEGEFRLGDPKEGGPRPGRRRCRQGLARQCSGKTEKVTGMAFF